MFPAQDLGGVLKSIFFYVYLVPPPQVYKPLGTPNPGFFETFPVPAAPIFNFPGPAAPIFHFSGPAAPIFQFFGACDAFLQFFGACGA